MDTEKIDLSAFLSEMKGAVGESTEIGHVHADATLCDLVLALAKHAGVEAQAQEILDIYNAQGWWYA